MESLPPIVQQLTKLLQSQPMFKLLRTMTGLEMADVPLSDDDDDDDSDDDDGDEGRKVWGEDEGEGYKTFANLRKRVLRIVQSK